MNETKKRGKESPRRHPRCSAHPYSELVSTWSESTLSSLTPSHKPLNWSGNSFPIFRSRTTLQEEGTTGKQVRGRFVQKSSFGKLVCGQLTGERWGAAGTSSSWCAFLVRKKRNICEVWVFHGLPGSGLKEVNNRVLQLDFRLITVCWIGSVKSLKKEIVAK